MSATPPRRRGRGPGPWLALVAAAAVPALLLWMIASWAAGIADQGNEPAPAVDPDAVIAEPAPALTTGIVGFRRMPTMLAREVNAADFERQIAAFAGSLNERSCVAVSIDGHDVGERNATMAVLPASNQKLPVAATALEVLGADYRYTTRVVAATGPIDGVIDGDLVLVGGGDPLLSSDWYPESNIERHPVTSPTSLDALADAVAAAGITRVAGAVLGDGSRYDDERYAPGWGVGVQGLEAGPYGALLVNDARVLGDEYKSDDPNVAAAREFTRLLQERNVQVAGTPGAGTATATAIEVASISSAPMGDVVRELLTTSDNNTAEMLVKELGSTVMLPGTRQAGLEVVADQLGAWGADLTPLVLADGSGLSLDNRLTCDALLTVLQHATFDSPLGQGLAVAGLTGTLSDIFIDHAVAGRLLGKTGSLNNPPFNEDPPAVKSLAGYLPVDGGGQVEYALVLNGPTISDQSEYRPVWNALADALATYPAGPTPAELGPR